jgi:predicted ArsR family transcriptional regulator
MGQNPMRGVAASGVLGEARARLLIELCGHPRSATDLAHRVGTSSNAVRVHLDGLRRAGLVDYRVERRGVGKPTHVFGLTPAAEYLLSNAYAPALRSIVAAARRRLNGGLRDLLLDAGAGLARQRTGGKEERRGLKAATAILRDLGVSASVERAGDHHVLRTACCPLGSVTRDEADACTLFEGMLREATGLHVREQCDRGAHPRCAFIVASREPRTEK